MSRPEELNDSGALLKEAKDLLNEVATESEEVMLKHSVELSEKDPEGMLDLSSAFNDLQDYAALLHNAFAREIMPAREQFKELSVLAGIFTSKYLGLMSKNGMNEGGES